MNSPAIWDKSIFLSTTKKNGNKKENLYRLFFLYQEKQSRMSRSRCSNKFWTYVSKHAVGGAAMDISYKIKKEKLILLYQENRKYVILKKNNF